ncbi:hypothetical protein CR513_18917, partial [Mucuna pruriens]
MSSNHMQFQQNMSATIQDLKKQIGQLANTLSQLQSVGSSNLPSQTIPNLRGNASAITLRTLQQLLRSTDADFEPDVDSQEEINIPLLDAIKQIPKYAKFLKELCVHKRKKMKGSVKIGGIVSALTRNEDFTAGAQLALPKKCRDPRIFYIPCTIGDCTFVDAMLDLGASINVMPTSIYKSLNFANRSVVQPLGVLEDVLVQVDELIFPADFYVLDMEDETSRKRSTLILGRPFLMTARTKIDVHAGTLSMEFGDTLVHTPTEDHSLFGIDLIDELVEEYLQLDNSSEDTSNLAEDIESIDCLGSLAKEANYDEVWEVHNLSDSEDGNIDLADLSQKVELIKLLDQLDPKESNDNSSSPPPPMELKSLPSHLKYAYLDAEQQVPEQEDKLLSVIRQHKKAIGWKLSDLLGINPSIYMHRILMKEESKPIRQQQSRMNPTILDVVKKEVTKLLVVGIIYLISDSQWVSPVQVVPKNSAMTITKN